MRSFAGFSCRFHQSKTPKPREYKKGVNKMIDYEYNMPERGYDRMRKEIQPGPSEIEDDRIPRDPGLQMIIKD